ncbi:MAG: serine/threonine-protein kinase [Myxococcota bacterium]|nr:serine/threonine-protein kinase [Myxococcota bacterium]
MDHLAEQRVLDLIGGGLPEPVALAAHEHLDRCTECRAVVANVLRSGEQVDDTLAHTPSASTVAEQPAALRAPRPAPVDQIEEYKLLEQVGRGGMGTVYRARDTLLDREVAIKLIARTSSDVARQRFLVEARAVARIRHPNVVVVHRVGVDGQRPYIVYDLVRGHTLADLRPPIPWFKVLEWSVGIARGLAAAHACGVLHRDLKPANIMLDEHDDIVLVDFGLAKLEAELAPAPTGALRAGNITETGATLGTPRYMAPESWQRSSPTPQTDFYSFGLVLYELMSGTLPFAGAELAELARAVCETDPPPLASVAPWVPSVLGELVDRCIAREPALRPVSAGTLSEELESIQRGRAFEGFERDRVRRVPHGNPYPGAKAFGYEHQGVFFGRSVELRSLIDQLRTRPLVVVAGDAGVGKTSLCMAGALPLVARGALAGARKWVPVPFAVGTDPIAALATAIGAHVERDPADLPRLLRDDPMPVLDEFRAGHRGGCTAHVLFVDDLDALAQLPHDEARHFATLLAKLCEPAPALRVLATLRTSEMISVAQLPGLSNVVGPALFLLLEPREPAALREIIVEPARLAGRTIDPGVVQSLVDLPLRTLAPRLAALWDELV